jgi:hypothetical protein
VQNSLFVPDLGRFLSRRPIYTLTPMPTRAPPVAPTPTRVEAVEEEEEEGGVERPQLTHTSTITSTISESRYAVLPHGKTLAGWSPNEKNELNDHVRHMLHSKRSKFKRGLRGFGQYVSKRECYEMRLGAVLMNPALGFLVTLYATLITLFGLAWVLFLIGILLYRCR